MFFTSNLIKLSSSLISHTMCMNTTEFDSYHRLKPKFNRRRQSKRRSMQGRRMYRKEMVMKNLKLYIKNQSIIQENEKLRMKALLLHQENTALFSLIQQTTTPPKS